MDLIKKPYEISLWKDELIWHRRKLKVVDTLTEDNYKPGIYYSQNKAVLGEA
jgi:hypothetical protein